VLLIRFLALLVFLHPSVWNFGLHRSGSFMAWAGTLVRFDCGPHVAIEWDEDGLSWTVAWVDRQDYADDFEAWARKAERRMGWKQETVIR
jgi:hypothetical protein